MIRRLNLGSWASIAALLLAPFPAAAQQAAPSAASDDEVFCISNGMMQSAGHGGLDRAGASALVSQCRQRFGWSDMETRVGVLVGQVTIGMQLALADADNAGVQRSVISDVIGTFDGQVIGAMQIQNLDPATGYPDMTRQATARFAERGVTGEAAAKATRAVILALMTIRLAANFTAALRDRDAH